MPVKRLSNFMARCVTRRALVLPLLALSLCASPWVQAEGEEDPHGDNLPVIPNVEDASKVNDNTIGLVFSADELFNEAINDLDREVAEHAGIRLVPILGKNDVQNVFDLLFLRGVDGAVFRTDALQYVRSRGNFPSVGNVVNAMVAIHVDKIVILANKDIRSVTDLNGKKMSMGDYASGEFITGTVLSDAYQITPEAVYAPMTESLEMLKNGEISALIYLIPSDGETLGARVDAPDLMSVREFDAGEQIHALALPGNDAIRAVYKPASLSAADLPTILGAEEEVSTYSVDTVLGAYRWRQNNPRYAKTARFVDAFIDSMHHLSTGEHQAFWGDLNITAPVHGMLSLGAVSDVLAQRQAAKEAELAAIKAQEEAVREAEREAKLAALNVQREQILKLLDEKITGASDSDALQELLDQVNSFADQLE